MAPKIVRRSQLVGVIFLILFAAILYRFYDLQVVQASFFQERAVDMYARESVLDSERGSIYDRHGKYLARDARAYTVIAMLSEDAPHYVQDVAGTAQDLSPILDMSESRIKELLEHHNRFQVEIRPPQWVINQEQMERIRDLERSGIIFKEESRRYYPNDVFASHLLGFINREGQPAMGLEASMDDYLSGQDGEIKFRIDRHGNRLPTGIDGISEPINGLDVHLTLDERIQLYVEQAMDQVIEEYNPKGMSVIVSDPQTGEILAMSSRPSFNPNEYSTIENYLNHSISLPFEPGSTFKILTLVAAVQEGVFDENQTFKSGTYTGIPGAPIRDHRPEGWGEISFLEGVQRSSNVAFVLLQEKLGKDAFYDYIYRFGFGQQTGIDLAQEHAGHVRPSDQSVPRDVASMAFGQAITTTAIQQIQAINAIANGGKLLRPYMIKQIVDPNQGTIIEENGPHIIDDQVISFQTSAKVRDLLESVIIDGTGQNYYLDGYQVAGKTGTAQKIGDDGRYVSNEYIHSFIGFAPKDEPKLSIHVMVDTPVLPAQGHIVSLGGAVVAQAFKSIMLQSLQYLKVAPEMEERADLLELENTAVAMQDYVGHSPMTARQAAEIDGFRVIMIGDGTNIEKQIPVAGQQIWPHETIYFMAGDLLRSHIPDLNGWSLKEAMDWAHLVGADLRVNGNGFVRRQSKAEGSIIRQGESLTIDLTPRNGS